jgi:hypothetical protein
VTEEDFKRHIIMWGVESAAPQFGTTIAILKGWMRGDSALPRQVWQNWVAWSSVPPEHRTPIIGAAVTPNMPVPGAAQLPDEHPALMKQSSLASRILADPAIAARIKAETERPPPVTLAEAGITLKEARPAAPAEPVVFEEEIPVVASSNGQTIKGAIAFCCPTDRDFPPVTMECFSVLIRNHQMPIVLKSDTLLVRGRNLIAERFLRTKAEWSFWADSDMILPMGNAEWFKDKSKITNLRAEQYGFDAVKRLMSHHQDIVGAVYASRTEGSQLVIQPDLEPRNDNDKTLSDLVRKNQAYGLKEVGWLGFGCVLVHRRVFEAVGRTDPEIRSGKAGFFDTPSAKGEDVRFCERAAVAGFKPKLDVELVCGHMGRKCFIPEQTRGK